MYKLTFLQLALLILGIYSNSASAQSSNSSNEITNATMKSYVAIFEIPATDLDRAVSFYQELLNIDIERMEFPGMAMGLFPYADQLVTGVIMQGEGYKPSEDGVTIYFHAGDNLQPVLDQVESNGGKILVPKTPHADESGFFALILDSEGNKIGLHSLN